MQFPRGVPGAVLLRAGPPLRPLRQCVTSPGPCPAQCNCTSHADCPAQQYYGLDTAPQPDHNICYSCEQCLAAPATYGRPFDGAACPAKCWCRAHTDCGGATYCGTAGASAKAVCVARDADRGCVDAWAVDGRYPGRAHRNALSGCALQCRAHGDCNAAAGQFCTADHRCRGCGRDCLPPYDALPTTARPMDRACPAQCCGYWGVLRFAPCEWEGEFRVYWAPSRPADAVPGLSREACRGAAVDPVCPYDQCGGCLANRLALSPDAVTSPDAAPWALAAFARCDARRLVDGAGRASVAARCSGFAVDTCARGARQCAPRPPEVRRWSRPGGCWWTSGWTRAG